MVLPEAEEVHRTVRAVILGALLGAILAIMSGSDKRKRRSSGR
jgi:hypothetical protein